MMKHLSCNSIEGCNELAIIIIYKTEHIINLVFYIAIVNLTPRQNEKKNKNKSIK